MFQYAVIAEPALTVAVSCKAPDVPSSLQASVDAVASVMGALNRKIEWELIVYVLNG